MRIEIGDWGLSYDSKDGGWWVKRVLMPAFSGERFPTPKRYGTAAEAGRELGRRVVGDASGEDLAELRAVLQAVTGEIVWVQGSGEDVQRRARP